MNRYDENWSKQWFGAGIFAEGSEEVPVDVFRKLERRKVLSTVEKAGLLSRAEQLGVTLSSLERLGLLSKAEDLGLLNLVEAAAGVSPSALAIVAAGHRRRGARGRGRRAVHGLHRACPPAGVGLSLLDRRHSRCCCFWPRAAPEFIYVHLCRFVAFEQCYWGA